MLGSGIARILNPNSGTTLIGMSVRLSQAGADDATLPLPMAGTHARRQVRTTSGLLLTNLADDER